MLIERLDLCRIISFKMNLRSQDNLLPFFFIFLFVEYFDNYCFLPAIINDNEVCLESVDIKKS